MSNYPDDDFVDKNIPINWQEIEYTTTDDIVNQSEDDIHSFFMKIRRLKVSRTDPDSTQSNLLHLFQLTQYCLEFVSL